MKNVKRAAALALCGLLVLGSLFGCSASATDGLQIIRIGHNQSTNHPTHTGLLAFEEYVEGELGDKYDIQIFPSELLGSQNEMVQLTQTGAITFCVASNSLLETFSDNYTLFNLPYLFASPEAYHASMDDPAIVDPIFESTMQAGFEAVTWLDAGTRNFYTINTPIETPADLRGLKIRVQQSPTNVRMMELLGYRVDPPSGAVRRDIIQMLHFGAPEPLKRFCRGIQFGAPVDSYVTPEPWDMPGYDCQVIMAAGAFIQGASIELSCDAPMREPYTAYLQGGLTYESGKAGVMLAVEELLRA